MEWCASDGQSPTNNRTDRVKLVHKNCECVLMDILPFQYLTLIQYGVSGGRNE